MFGLVFFGIFIYVFVVAIKSATRRQNGAGGNGNYGGMAYQNRPTQGQPNKYSTINSHYSQETLRGTANGNGRNPQQVTPSPMAGTFMANGTSDDHNHAYEHKVEPIEEASVHEKFEDRKEAYRERKAQMKADLPKTSYSKVEQKVKSSNGGMYRGIHRNSAKNGDNGYMPNRSEKAVKCSYCGANNIIPWDSNVKYNCYFCREEL